MPELDILRSLILDDLFTALLPKDGTYSAKLRENDPSAKLKVVFVNSLPCDAVVLHFDKCRDTRPRSLFKGGSGPLSCCDYVLLIQWANQRVALFVELKSKKLRRITEKFKASECLLDYCDAALNRFFEQQRLLAQYRRGFIVFHLAPLNKRPTRPTIRPEGESADQFLKYPNPSPQGVSLNELMRLLFRPF